MSLRDIFVSFHTSVDQQPLVDAQKNVNALVVKMNQLQRIAGFALAALGVGAITESADAYTVMSNRLKTVTNGAAEFEQAQRGVFDIARQTATPVEDVAAAFQRYVTVTDALNLSTADTLDFTLRLTQGLKLSGATGQETAAVLVQLGQGMANNFKSGGQELNSLIEQAPKLATELAKAIGGPEATAYQLKNMAKAGKLTGQAIVDAVRGMGQAYDKVFSKRVRTFEEQRILFGIEWLALMKQIQPALLKVTAAITDLVGWVRAWVADGSAVNTLIAAMIVGVIALTAAFAPLIASLIAAAAPWTALFLIIEDFVGFMRGDDSLIGRFFEDHGGAENARKKILEIWDVAKQLFEFVRNPSDDTWKPFYESAAKWIFKIGELFESVIRNAVAALGKAVDDDPALSTLIKGLQLVVGKPGDKSDVNQEAQGPQLVAPGGPNDINQTQQNNPVAYWLGSKLMGEEQMQAIQQRARERSTAMGQGPDYFDTIPKGVSGIGGGTTNNVNSPMAITNNVTVQGNATASTARDVATETGKATSAALGRDRSAVGASFGVAP